MCPLVIAAFTLTASAEIKPPNIIWIVGDDLGTELGCYGNPDVKTPNTDRLAKEGIRYTNAFSTAPVCSASRSAFMTGMYQTHIGLQDHRKMLRVPLPDGVETITAHLTKKGYTCVNPIGLGANGKRDFNFEPDNAFESDDMAVMEKTVADGKPLFVQFSIHEPHREFVPLSEGDIDPAKVTLPEKYPDDPLVREDWARYLTSVEVFDQKVGGILDWLEKRGIANNTIVFLFGDHGRPHVWDKQWTSDGGLHTVLIVRALDGNLEGKVDERLVSLIDISAQTLVEAGVAPLPKIDGRAFIGPDTTPRKYVYAARDRCGDAFDRIRSVNDGRFHYVRNYYPELPYWQTSRYKVMEYPALARLKELHSEGKLSPAQDRYFADTKPREELYDLEKDPGESHNLAANPEYAEVLQRLQKGLADWQEDVPDMGAKPDSPEEYAAGVAGAKKGYRKFESDDWDKRSEEIVEKLKARNLMPAEAQSGDN